MKYHVLSFTDNFSSHSLIKVFSSLPSAKKFVLKNKKIYSVLSIYCYKSNHSFSHSYTFDKLTDTFSKYR